MQQQPYLQKRNFVPHLLKLAYRIVFMPGQHETLDSLPGI